MVDRIEETQWYWLEVDGKSVAGDERDLVHKLSLGTLPAGVLVWRHGWSEWVPASRVPKLAGMMPSFLRDPSLNQRRESSRVPPSVPTRSRPAVDPPIRSSPSVEPTPLSRPETNRVTVRPIVEVRPRTAEYSEPSPDTPIPSSFGVWAKRPSRFTTTLRSPTGVAPPARTLPPVPMRDAPRSSPVSSPPASSPRVAAPPSSPRVSAPPVSSPRASAPPSSPPASSPRDRKRSPPPAPLSRPRPGHLVEVSAEEVDLREEGPPSRNAPPPPPRRGPRTGQNLESSERALDVDLPISEGRISTRSLFDAEAQSTPEQVELPRPAPPPPVRRPTVRAAPNGFESRGALLGLGALCLVAIVGAWILITRHAVDPVPIPAPAASMEPVPKAAEEPTTTCALLQPAARLFTSIERSVPPRATAAPGGDRLAVGFAATKTRALGLLIDPENLDVSNAFDQDVKLSVRGVTPFTRSGSVGFIVDRDERVVAPARPGDPAAKAPLPALGAAGAAPAFAFGDEVPLGWPGEDPKLTEARSAHIDGFGYGVAVRRTAQSDRILLGWLGDDAHPKSDLFPIAGGLKLVGTPSIATAPGNAVVVFAGRTAPARSRVFVSSAAPGAAPTPARELASLTPGGDATSPAVASLGDGRWLVAWTEAVSGESRVRVQILTSDLKPFDDAVLVSPKGASASQGTLWTHGTSVVALFILTSSGHDELWATALGCR